MIETVDVITPIVDDPFTFGAICASNSVSDVYAMGGTPLTALAILGFATCDFAPNIIRRLLKGAISKLDEAGVCLIGGHTIEDNEFKFGFAISGMAKKNVILKVAGAKPGDILVLTKQLGTGILTSAVKKHKVGKQYLRAAIDSMLMLNKTASEAAVSAGAHAATDITGFGLLGHGMNIAKSSKVNLIIESEKVPFMKKVRELARAGLVPKGARSNLDYCSKSTSFDENITDGYRLALADPQTSGGLLVSLPPKGLIKFDRVAKKGKMPYWIIGEVKKGMGRIIVR
jgi:selenide,water dikinase